MPLRRLDRTSTLDVFEKAFDKWVDPTKLTKIYRTCSSANNNIPLSHHMKEGTSSDQQAPSLEPAGSPKLTRSTTRYRFGPFTKRTARESYGMQLNLGDPESEHNHSFIFSCSLAPSCDGSVLGKNRNLRSDLIVQPSFSDPGNNALNRTSSPSP